MPAINDAQFRPQCIITGCYLTHRHRVLYGDLHAFQQTWIFNAVLTAGGDAHEREEAPMQTQRILKVFDHYEVFERRGVIVIPFLGSRLNAAAEAYIGSTPA